MDKRAIEISLLQDADIASVNELHNFIYKDDRDELKFNWEFRKAPAGPAIYVVAKDPSTGKIVGTQCAIPIELITGTGEKILTAKSEDTLVDPGYRGMNIFENMYNLLFEECRKAGIRYIWGFTSAQKPFLKLGFEIPYAHSQSLMAKNILRSYTYLSALNPKNTTSSRIKISGLCFLSKINSFRAVFHSGSSSGHKIQVAISTPGEFIDNSTLIQRILAAYPGSFMINQDRGYSDWRLVHNPYHSKLFTITFTDDTGKVATFSFNHHKNGVWYLIQDLSVPELMGRQHAAFLTKAVKALCASEKNGVKLIRTWDFTHHEYARNELSARKKAGFLHLGRGISFVWKCLDNSKPLMPDQFILSRIASQGVI